MDKQTEPLQRDPVHADADPRFLPWRWVDPRDGEHFRRCSYCGSIHPDDLAAEPAWRADWAEPKYGWPHKFYVDVVSRDPDRIYTIGTTNGEQPLHDGWTPVGELTDEQRGICARDRIPLDGTTFVLFGKRPYHRAKFYSVHFADPALSGVSREIIEQRSGLVFVFDGDTVEWRPTPR